ncbi:MFS general substrate transporter [Guyanagaster necrorhizus]|uniref:MFS general substrate transporter n=1 Tax=Guyanagaster necrorhizus TaxID=856835 RepID=A0A9P7W6X1_9AGAR|nr:MFS general substrate transporter [Guyanagaster necrorhizus MCA 3950]KAG7453248.1 MFS general substrate transporter [Guyanagaster necrorhizus MCA 3950]
MDSESTPLLEEVSRHEKIYNRFSPIQKRTIVALVSWSALVPMFASGSFIPAIPQIAHDMNTTGTTISFAVSLSIFAASLGGMVFATYSSFYGRRPVYLIGTPLLTLGSIGVALSRSVPEMMVCRFIQAFGTSGGMSVGAAVIGDIYKLTERGTAMGIFFGATLLGPALSPLAGGWGAHYASWRWTQIALAFAGFAAFMLMFFFLPETSHPGSRGIDKMLEEEDAKQRKWVWLNPFSPLALLRSPNLMLSTLSGAAVLITDFALFIPIAYTIGVKYNITNEFIIGACFVPGGLGNIVGAPLAGYLSDRAVIMSRKKYGANSWRPEERLRAALIGTLIPVPLSVLFSGLITQYIDGPLGLVLNLLCFFINGVGVDMALTPATAYAVDILHSRSAEIMAASMGLRSAILSVSVALVLPSIKRYGVAVTDSIAALIGWSAFVMVWVTIRYGKRMREWVDVGYSTATDT